MRAIIVKEPGRLEMIAKAAPTLEGPTQVLVKIKAAGICGSDLHVKHGTNPYAVYPRIIGHEAAGEILKVGSQVTDLRPGDGVVFEPITYCGQCYACRTGHHNVCSRLNVLGCTVDGVFQDYVVCEQSQVYRFDREKMSYRQAALCEPYTIGAQANWRGDVKKGDVVLVHGAGPIGLIVADVAKSRGATVIVTEPNEHRLKMAKEFGADYWINPNQDEVDELIKQITNGEGVNVVFEAAGVPRLLMESISLLSPAGRLVAMTFGARPVPLDFKSINQKELSILGTRHQYEKFSEVIHWLPLHLKQVNALITHVFAIEEFGEAFQLLEKKSSNTGKVLLEFE